jgi:plasmid stabilization system protein ParE
MNNREVIFRREARLELEEAYHWYESKRQGLGEEFLLVVDAAIEHACRSPELAPVIYRNVRRVLTRRFPYGIFYVAKQHRIVVIAVFHGRRNPKTIEDRTRVR